MVTGVSDKNPSEPRSRHDPEFSEAVGRAIKVLRAARGLSRKDVAEAAGISYPYLSEIENGAKPGSARALRPIAEALGVPLHELFAAAEELLGGESADRTAPTVQSAFSVIPMDTAPGSRWFRPARGHVPAAAAPGPEPAQRGRAGGERRARVTELQRLIESMSDEDLERLLDLARRLSG
jgi:transcriptional regulator with XRE-family HTH domain